VCGKRNKKNTFGDTMKCRVDECNKITQSKMGYCKKHLKERKLLLEKIEDYCIKRGFPRKNFDYYSLEGLKQTCLDAQRWIVGGKRW
jgi:hypothetical protein